MSTNILSGLVVANRRTVLSASPGFRRLLGSLAISGLGDWMYGLAVATWILDQTGSPTMVAVAVVARLAPFALFGAFGGVAADRYDRRRLLITLDIVSAIILAVLVAIVVWDGPVAVAIVCVMLSALATVPYRSAAPAILPSLVDVTHLEVANALEAAIGETTMLVGPAIAALLLGTVKPEFVIGFDAATFVISALLLRRLPTSTQTRRVQRTHWTNELCAGIRTVRTTPGASALLALVGVSLIANGATLVSNIVFAKEQLGIGATGAGYLLSASAFGALVSTAFTARITTRYRIGQVLTAAGVMLGVAYLVISITTSIVVACCVMICEGIAGMILYVTSMTAWQRTIAHDTLGRVLGLQETTIGCSAVAGAITVAVLIRSVGVAPAIGITGICVATFSALLGPALQTLNTARFSTVTNAPQLTDSIVEAA